MIADREFILMQDFIGGRLSDDECRAFEDRLVRDPALARELEQSLRLREGLQRLRTRGYIRRAAASSSSFRTWLPAALAAAAIGGLALFLWPLRVAGPAPLLLASPDAPSTENLAHRSAAHFTFLSVRGGPVPDLELPSAGLIEIRAAPSLHRTAGRYRVTLVRANQGSSATLASVGGLALSSDGYVHCFAEASRLTAGRYGLRIEPDGDTAGVPDTFPFNLTAGATGSSR